ncbi:hypothetical protein LY284_37065 [Caballeronia sp. PC1]|nr:hypothetical protein [Caballeronia sp. PC1]MCE4547918.1 hypothetical protein [Caballeronia sp. PC1]
MTGFTGQDGSGQEGMERFAEQRLRGADGHRRVLRNTRGQVIDTLSVQAPRNGRDLALAIDRSLLYAAFGALRDAVMRSNARSGSAILLDAHTGEVLAMANWPSYDRISTMHEVAWKCAIAP